MPSIEVGGLIGIRWRQWGGADGPFGNPTTPELEVPGQPGRRQTFERGEISWSSDHNMICSVFQLRNEVCFEWSRPEFDHDFFRYDVTFNGVSQGQNVMEFRSTERGSIRIWNTLQGFGEYGYSVRPCEGSECRNATIPVRVRFDKFPGTPDPAMPAVTGLIGDRWHEHGAWDGPLGKPLNVVAPSASSRSFENGMIITAPEFGPNMVVSAFQRHDTIEIHWGGADFPFNAFRVNALFPGGGAAEQFVWLNLNTDWARPGIGSGRVVFTGLADAGGFGGYDFFVFPAHNPSPLPDIFLFPNSVIPTPDGPPPGATPRIRVKFREPFRLWDSSSAPTPNARIPVTAVDGTPAGAFASHDYRSAAITAHYALTHPLLMSDKNPTKAEEDTTIRLIAHLAMADAEPGFRTPGELPSRLLTHVWLRQLDKGDGVVGTKDATFKPKGDYDMALKGLMTAIHRYGHLLTAEEIERALVDLVPPVLSGPLNIGLHEFVVLTDDAPETENHILMIESTRYLTNQLLFDRLDADPKFDNNANGLTAWLLEHLQQFAKHDFLEFNARPYQRLSLHAIYNLFEFARDEPIRTAAKIVLDYSTTKFAVSSCRMRRVTPFRRLKENTNTAAKNNDLITPVGSDQLQPMMYTYTGATDRDAGPRATYPDGLVSSGVGVIASLSSYRPPPATYDLAMTTWGAEQHRFHHGKRPPLHEADEDAEPGVEIYYRSPSFLFTAGGMWLNSGYGRDEFQGFKQVAIPQSTTLMFTRGFDVKDRPELDLTFVDLIRFDRWPNVYENGMAIERPTTNMAVHKGFACGANLEVPDKWLALTGATWERPNQAGWLLLNLNGPLPDYGPLGLYVAVYRTGIDAREAEDLSFRYVLEMGGGIPPVLSVPPKSFGLIYAVEANTIDPATGAPIHFETFKNRVTQSNQFPDPLRWNSRHVFKTVDGHSYKFWLRPDYDAADAPKMAPRIVEEDGQVLLPNGFGALPLADGKYLRATGHEGLIEIRRPNSDVPLVLNYRDPKNPIYLDTRISDPEPWIERTVASFAFAAKVAAAQPMSRIPAGVGAAARLYDELLRLNTDKHGPRLAAGVIDGLAAIGVDFSVRRSELLEFLANPLFTPYPALAQALLLLNRRLLKPVFIDVIRFKYEDVLGTPSPRVVGDVVTDKLQQAVVESWNVRYGVEETDFGRILVP
ncbi:hypothetical protein ABIF97_001016 [Bradyrhizobium japonicum]